MRFLTIFIGISTLVTGCRTTSFPQNNHDGNLQSVAAPACPNVNQGAGLADSCSNLFKVTAHPPAGQDVIATAGVKEHECGYYLRLRLCLTDCSESERNRLLGYYQTCMGVTGLASGDYKFVEGCAGNQEFTSYMETMRHCLQKSSVAFNTDNDCHSCKQIIDGAGGPYDGIIGSHTPCNGSAGFCDLSETSLRCFGAGMGSSWTGVLGSHSATGSIRSVGFCHLVSQAASCAASSEQGYGAFMTFWRALCGGYQAGCEAVQGGTGTFVGNAIESIAGGGSRTFDAVSCKLSCPLPEDLNRVSGFGGNGAGYLFEKISAAVGRGGVLAGESACRGMVGTF